MNGKYAIVCKHVLDAPSCAKCAFKTTPSDLDDSGWQFLCGEREHSAGDARILSVAEIMALLPSAAAIIDAKELGLFVFDGSRWSRLDGRRFNQTRRRRA